MRSWEQLEGETLTDFPLWRGIVIKAPQVFNMRMMLMRVMMVVMMVWMLMIMMIMAILQKILSTVEWGLSSKWHSSVDGDDH